MTDFSDYEHIFKVKYREQIATLCQPIFGYHDISDISLCLYTNRGDRIWFGTKPTAAIEYVEKGFDRSDNKYLRETHVGKTVTFYDDTPDFVGTLIEDFAQKERDTCRVYTIIRRCSDCELLLTPGIPYQPISAKTFYNNTIDRFETFCCDLVDGIIDALVAELPALKPTRFATDSRYRHFVIKNRALPKVLTLTDRERNLLYWAAQGKTTDEIAMIMGLSNKTIQTYRSQLIEKFEVSNLLQAVYAAMAAGLIT